jgi:S1-C subfamily serine protease
MNTNLKAVIAIVATVFAVASASTVNAQQLQATSPQLQVQPQVGQSWIQPPPAQNQFYFGVQVALKRNNWGGTTLQIVSVTPGSPAQIAGLEHGDEIRTVNGRNFNYATDSFDAVRLMNQFVTTPIVGAPGAPAVAAAIQGGAQAAYVPLPQPIPTPIARMVVRNVRNGQNVIVNVRPQQRGFAPGAPAAAATVQAYSN